MGVPRVYAYLGNQTPTPEAFAWAEKYGHTFITYGPLIFSNPIPGSIIYVGPNMDKVILKLRVVAVDGISRVAVMTKGRTLIYNNIIQGKPVEVNLTIELSANEVLKGEELSWLSIIAWDAHGDLAITNPIWVSKSVVGAVKTETQTITQTIVQTQTKTLMQTITQTEVRTPTITTVTPTTIVSSTTVKETVTEVRWDLIVATTITFLAIGFILGYVIHKKIS